MRQRDRGTGGQGKSRPKADGYGRALLCKCSTTLGSSLKSAFTRKRGSGGSHLHTCLSFCPCQSPTLPENQSRDHTRTHSNKTLAKPSLPQPQRCAFFLFVVMYVANAARERQLGICSLSCLVRSLLPCPCGVVYPPRMGSRSPDLADRLRDDEF